LQSILLWCGGLVLPKLGAGQGQELHSLQAAVAAACSSNTRFLSPSPAS
jgi:hypothetical protein